jgi:predicted O-methyltransferase YrrM
MIKQHWTLTFLFNKLKNRIWEMQNPDSPWLAPDSVRLLNELIKPTDIGLEFGSGRSTNWLAQRMQHLTSVEDNKAWFDIVDTQLKGSNRSNVDYLFKDSQNNGKPENSDYCKVVEKFSDHSLDFVLVDGSHRGILMLLCAPKVKVGGMLVLDNANWFLPHATKTPSSIGSGEIIDANFKNFYANLSDWRLIWSTNGFADTAIFIKIK